MEVRSTQASKYMWSLIDKLAEKQGTDYLEVYKRFIKQYGTFIWVLVPKDQLEDFLIQWSSHGSGWMAERIKEMPNGIAVKAYKGTSIYSPSELNRLIEGIQRECKAHGIETMTDAELQRLQGA